jgi:hypothetical protein
MVLSAFDLCQLGEPGPPASTYAASQPFCRNTTSMPAARAAAMVRAMLAMVPCAPEMSKPAESTYPPSEA